MRLINTDVLAGYSAALDALTEDQRAALGEIVFCYRLGALSTTAVFNDVESLREVAGHVPDEIASAVTQRYRVDLESLKNERVRFYVDGDEPESVLHGSPIQPWARWKNGNDIDEIPTANSAS